MSHEIKIEYEDNDVLVVNKPVGLVVHADGKTDEATLVDWILEHYPQIAHVGEPLHTSRDKPSAKEEGTEILRPGIVHRLDRGTSGVLMLVKNQNSFEYFKKQFQDREITKIYNAFVYGEMKDAEGIIDRSIGKSKKDFRLWSAQRGARGTLREAVTEYKVLKTSKDFSFVEVRPKTGRTHQIRVHFKAINHPVVCDSLYAPKRPCELGFKRLALHALSLEFTTISGEIIIAEAALPNDFQKALLALLG